MDLSTAVTIEITHDIPLSAREFSEAFSVVCGVLEEAFEGFLEIDSFKSLDAMARGKKRDTNRKKVLRLVGGINGTMAITDERANKEIVEGIPRRIGNKIAAMVSPRDDKNFAPGSESDNNQSMSRKCVFVTVRSDGSINIGIDISASHPTGRD